MPDHQDIEGNINSFVTYAMSLNSDLADINGLKVKVNRDKRMSIDTSRPIEELVSRYNKAKSFLPQGTDFDDIRIYSNPRDIQLKPNTEYATFTISSQQLELAKDISKRTASIANFMELGNTPQATQAYTELQNYMEIKKGEMLNGLEGMPDIDDLIGIDTNGGVNPENAAIVDVIVFAAIVYTL
ncbi:hypothetical protein BC455_04775 [Vibrio harveyi]|uniref:hypothetical protein n=1 Tax=Vibrio harveyi group TaxID=717610 RepID=UPI000841BA76|nr:hypothetical protein [Vibrio harveyi]ODM55880.1 hypothetical protein BC455_04775 [Vibrio harveyi]